MVQLSQVNRLKMEDNNYDDFTDNIIKPQSQNNLKDRVENFPQIMKQCSQFVFQNVLNILSVIKNTNISYSVPSSSVRQSSESFSLIDSSGYRGLVTKSGFVIRGG